jgi:hypothetical protein
MRYLHNIYSNRGLAFDITYLVSTLNTYLEKKSYDLFLLCLSLLYCAHNHVYTSNLHVEKLYDLFVQ